jgi:hypothetical protein
MKINVLYSVSRMNGRGEKFMKKFYSENEENLDHLEDIIGNGRIALILILMK